MNKFTSTLDLKYPIVQGPFGGGLSSIELVKTVSNFGGLGSFGAHHLSPERIEVLVKELNAATSGAFSINLWVSNNDHYISALSRSKYAEYAERFEPIYARLGVTVPPYKEFLSEDFDEQLQAAISAGPPAISFVFGVPSAAALAECRRKNIITMGTATTLKEALMLEEAGVDIIVASGFEAGGHRVSFLQEPEDCLMGGMALIPQVADRISAPIIAAGGIADVRGVRAAMSLGAQGVQIGTAFLACQESGTSDLHKRVLRKNRAHQTVLSRAYTGRLARFIENDFIREINNAPDLPLPFPIQSYFAAPIKEAAIEQGSAGFAAHYAGQNAPLLHHSKAMDLLESLVVDF